MTQNENALFRCPIRVSRGTSTGMPSQFDEAIVECFVAAPEWQGATRLAVGHLQSMGLVFEDLHGRQVEQLDPQLWDEWVASSWPEFPGYFPPQADMLRFIKAGGVFRGPFLAWKEGE